MISLGPDVRSQPLDKNLNKGCALGTPEVVLSLLLHLATGKIRLPVPFYNVITRSAIHEISQPPTRTKISLKASGRTASLTSIFR